MAKLPYMPWYPADVLSSSDYVLMSPLERLAYRELLDRCWMSGGRLPADVAQLSRLTAGEVSDAVMAKFVEIEGSGMVTNMRLAAEYSRAEARHDALSEAGRKGGYSKATSQAKARPKRGHKPGSGNQNQNQNHISPNGDNNNTPVANATAPKGVTSSKFVRPSIEDVAAYIAENGYAVDPQQWMDYYTGNGWKVGRNAMKDWQATVRTWHRNGYGKGGSGNPAKPPRTYTGGGRSDTEAWDNVPL